jgi:hypothetical protein
MIENPLHSFARTIVDKFFPPDNVVIKVKHPTRVQRILGQTEVIIPRSQLKNVAAVKNALNSLEVPSVFS